MTRPQQSLMEVTGALSAQARSARFTFGDDTVLVAVQHMLAQTIDLFRAAGEIGLKPENIFALGKVYSNSAPVIKTIKNMGATVVESTFPRPGEFEESFEQDIKRFWAVVAEKLAQRCINRIIVLDDGGKCISGVPAELLAQYRFAGVEQTSMGMFIFEETPPPFAVFSWARTAVKLQIGGHIFSQCLIDKLHSDFLHGQSLQGVDVGIIGLGSIGRRLADVTAREGSSVWFYDPNPRLKVPHYLRGRVTRLDSLEELMLRCEIVFGASGRNPFKDKWPMAHRPGIKLISASGGDQEFRPIIRQLQRGPTFNVAGTAWDITSDDGPSGPICIAYLGFPYNFVSRVEEAVPTRIVQLETGGLLAGLIQARSFLTLIEEGDEQNRGIHRISPEAQQFVYQSWLKAMNDLGIDLREIYGHHPALLEATKYPNWFGEHTEPGPEDDQGSGRRSEEIIRSILDHRFYSGTMKRISVPCDRVELI